MHNKVPNLLSRKYPDRAARWTKTLAFEDVARSSDAPVTAAYYELPARHPGIVGRKIAFFSDAHCRDTKKCRRIVESAAHLIDGFHPDYLICGGDWIGDAGDIDFGREMLALLPDAPVKLAAAGNWERSKFWLEPDFWRDYFAQSGFRMLINELYQDDAVAFFGIDDPKGGSPRGGIQWPDGIEKILISHNPDTAVMIDFAGLLGEVDLVLSGHTHAGQIRLPWIGAPITSSLYHKFDAGLFTRRKSGTHLIISSGLGSLSFPFRFRCPPEVVFLTFTPPFGAKHEKTPHGVRGKSDS